jgi:signal transduction histidine kinase
MDDDKFLQALELCEREDWDGAKSSLEDLSTPAAARLAALITVRQKREAELLQMLAVARHELGNKLSIAQANLEAMLDGVLEITPERLSAVVQSLKSAGSIVVDLKYS